MSKIISDKIEDFQKMRCHFILDENNNVIPANVKEWSDFFNREKRTRIVKQDDIDGKYVSTVFLGLVHSSYDDKLDIFETMVFNDSEDIYCERYDTWKEAEEGHQKAIQWVKDGCKEDE